jgi:hypothetical protein
MFREPTENQREAPAYGVHVEARDFHSGGPSRKVSIAGFRSGKLEATMLCVNRYTTDYIDECRTRMDAQLAAYRALVATRQRQTWPSNRSSRCFFANLVVALEGSFVHRSRTLELKDGNALNEVRTLSNSIINNRVMAADKTIKYDPSKSVFEDCGRGGDPAE